MRQRSIIAITLVLMWTAISTAAEPWATYRGNGQRTGNNDGQAGPASPKVLWAIPSKDHYIASPVFAGERVLVSGLGAFNVSHFGSYPIQPKGMPGATWAKTVPYLKLPTVSSPAVAGDYLIFGDGMHQTSGAILYCVRADNGQPVWQLPVPGELVHLEGCPTVVGNRLYIGGGAAGVMCIEWDQLTLDGKATSIAEVSKMQERRWKELQAKYEADKKNDPDFAVPPNEDNLLKPTPKVVWQMGKEKWHVDAPIAVAGNLVLVSSSYLDKEKLGTRALIALDAATGEQKWQAPLKYNPWGGATVQGNTVIVPGASVGYYYNEIKTAKGDITGIDLESGKVKWRKDVPAGIVSCAAIADGLAVTTATDGKVRAYSITDGERRWIYDAKMPIFAPPAIAAGVIYIGDLKGVVHAVNLKDGIGKWTLDLGTDPAVKAPGMIYGGISIEGGKLIVATCNLEGPLARQPTTIVCIGSK